MCTHTWDDPEIYQRWTLNLAKQDDWWKETQKECPIKVIQTTTKLGLSPLLCLSTHPVLLFLLVNILFHYFLSLCRNSFLHSLWARVLSLPPVPGGLLARVLHSHCCGLILVSDQENWNLASSHFWLRPPETSSDAYLVSLHNSSFSLLWKFSLKSYMM